MVFPQTLIQTLRSSTNIAVLTGAGVSQESGLRTFRDSREPSIPAAEQPLWAQFRPEDLATSQAFERDPQMVWEFYAMRRLKAGEVKPNPAHLALAEMGRRIPQFTLITQNVDGLHQRAGSEAVLELHGNITRVRCTQGCGVFTEWKDTLGEVPACPNCGSNLRPDVVWFGEILPQMELQKSLEAARHCEIFFSIGTSALVQPAASLALIARDAKAVVVEVNAEKTPLTPFVDHFVQGKAGEILPELVRQAWGD